MNILLLGEFSALHKNLADGLCVLGHQVLTASDGNSWRKIKSNIIFESKLPGRWGTYEKEIVSPLKYRDKLVGHDVIQLINPHIFSKIMGFNKKYIRHLINNNEKSFLLACGDDALFWENHTQMRYSPLNDYKKYDLQLQEYPLEQANAYKWNVELANKVNGIIPVMIEYTYGYNNFKNRKNTLPIPINVDDIEYIENIPGKKLVIFHGLNREGFKGTHHVRKAFSRLQRKYPNDLEFVLDGGLPLNQYLDIMKRTNVVIDQTSSYSCGVNAIYALAQGKVVLGGAEPESLQELGIEKSPVINILPDPLDIEKKILYLLDNRNMITEMGYQSRLFAEKNHNYINIASDYVDIWKNS